MASASKNRGSRPGTSQVKKQRQIKGKPEKATKEKSQAYGNNLLQSFDSHIGAHMNLMFFISLFLTIFIGAMLFDVKISTGGDDSSYIEMANNFMKGRSFPTWHGPLYSIFLSLPILLFGVKVIWLKMFSFFFILGHLVMVYYTFRKHLSPTLLTLVMLIVSVSSSILYFASQTYSEAMFMFLQSLIIYLFINAYLLTLSPQGVTLKEEGLHWFILGFFVLLASLTRNIGIVALLSMVLFLLVEKKFRAALMLTISYILFLVPFKIYKSVMWESGRAKTGGQLSEILLKNPYNKALGSEDLSGMITRFFENARLYLSKHFMIGIGLHDPGSTDKSWFVTAIIAVLFIIALYYAFRRSKIMLFVAIYLGASMSATFIALQQSWDQMRMVVIYFPLLLLLLSWGLQQLATKKGYRFLIALLPLLLVFIFFKTLGQSVEKMKVNQKVLVKNIHGNQYYGFTPDWQNFLRMSEWVGKNIPDTVVVASRKPSMSFIYSNGRDFYGIYRFPSEAPEKLLGTLIPRTGALKVIPNKEIPNNWPVGLLMAIKKANVAYVAEGNDIYGVYDLKGPSGDSISQALAAHNVIPFTTDSILNRVRSSAQSCFAVSPDSLIHTLQLNKVDYVIVASLRANPNFNTGNIINNIQRYLFFIEQKYPGILTLVHQIGANEQEEPAWLYQINYRLYGM
jgi:hypothetical protein